MQLPPHPAQHRQLWTCPHPVTLSCSGHIHSPAFLGYSSRNHRAASAWFSSGVLGAPQQKNPSELLHTTSSFYSKGSRVEFPRQDLQPLCTAHPQPHLLHPILPSAISLGAHKGQQGCPCPVQVPVQIAGTGFPLFALCASPSQHS